MSDNAEAMRRQAEEDFRRSQQTELANAQMINDHQARNDYNNELERQRRLEESGSVRSDSI